MKRENVLPAKISEMEQKTCLTAGRNRFLLDIITVTLSKKHNLFVRSHVKGKNESLVGNRTY